MNNSLKDILLAALFTAFIAVGAMITVPLGPIPFTLQTFAITLVMYIAKPKTAVLSMLIYVILGAIGAPIFSSFKGGIGVLMGPTGGFIWGYLIAIFPICFAVNKIKANVDSPALAKVAVVCCGLLMTLIAYGFGTAQYMAVAGVSMAVALTTCVIPFVIIDLCKIVVAWAISLLVNKHLNLAE